MAAAKRPTRVARYAAFLRGVSPMNLKMPELKACFEEAGFTDVKTVISSGNVVFSAQGAPLATLELRAEGAMLERLGRTFSTIVRPIADLRALLESDPFSEFKLAAGAKRIVTFVKRETESVPRLPITADGARILTVRGRDVFTAYVPSPRGAVFMRLIQKTFGKDVTTRTWDTVRKVAK